MDCNSELPYTVPSRLVRVLMSKPPLFPQQSASGIAVDPRTFERVIPESKRPDGSCVAWF